MRPRLRGHRRLLDAWHRYVYKPYYIHSPGRLLRRLAGAGSTVATELPWGLPLSFQPGSIIGTQLRRTGVHDLVLTEALHRITRPGDVCIDVGANIGYTTSILASRCGRDGVVISFEPGPDVYALLTQNIRSWNRRPIAEVDARQLALSDAAAELTLTTPLAHDGDSGGRTLEPVDEALASVTVACSTLDAEVPRRVDVLKVDVEGHELAVLRGAERLLAGRRVRHVVFEDHRPPPTAVTELLAEAGYSVFRIEQATRGPRLVEEIEREFAVYWDAPNYLATTDPAGVRQAFAGPGWHCLRRARG